LTRKRKLEWNTRRTKAEEYAMFGNGVDLEVKEAQR